MFHISFLLIYIWTSAKYLYIMVLWKDLQALLFLVESLFCWTVAFLALQKALKVTVILRSFLFPCGLSPLPAQLGKGALCWNTQGLSASDSVRHLRQLALLLSCSCLPPSAGDIWAAWLLSSTPAADLTLHCQPLACGSTVLASLPLSPPWSPLLWQLTFWKV